MNLTDEDIAAISAVVAQEVENSNDMTKADGTGHALAVAKVGRAAQEILSHAETIREMAPEDRDVAVAEWVGDSTLRKAVWDALSGKVLGKSDPRIRHVAIPESLQKGWFSSEKYGLAGQTGVGVWDEADHPRDARGRFTAKMDEARSGEGFDEKSTGKKIVGDILIEDANKAINRINTLVSEKKIPKKEGEYLVAPWGPIVGTAIGVIDGVNSGGDDPVKALQVWHNWVRGSRMDFDKKGRIATGFYNIDNDDLDDTPKAPIAPMKKSAGEQVLDLMKADDEKQEPSRFTRYARTGAVIGATLGAARGAVGGFATGRYLGRGKKRLAAAGAVGGGLRGGLKGAAVGIGAWALTTPFQKSLPLGELRKAIPDELRKELQGLPIHEQDLALKDLREALFEFDELAKTLDGAPRAKIEAAVDDFMLSGDIELRKFVPALMAGLSTVASVAPYATKVGRALMAAKKPVSRAYGAARGAASAIGGSRIGRAASGAASAFNNSRIGRAVNSPATTAASFGGSLGASAYSERQKQGM